VLSRIVKTSTGYGHTYSSRCESSLMKCYIYLITTLFLLHHLRLDATRSCNVSSFTHSLNGTQCFGLVQVVDGITSYSECETACCSISSCEMFEWCSSSNPACGSYAGTCWTGQADLTKCVPSAEWQGAYRTLPPPPPRLPQRFLRPYTQSPTLPLAVLDLADETRGSATWTIQVDNEPLRSVYVPSGGYNSDQQICHSLIVYLLILQPITLVNLPCI
jgi:hypothetical protein